MATPIAPNPLEGFMNNPMTQVGMGLLGGNYGRDSSAAFANSMRGGLLGLHQANRNQILQQQHQMTQQQFAAPAKPKIIKGADGYNYYAETGKRVLPGVQAAPKEPLVKIFGEQETEYTKGLGKLQAKVVEGSALAGETASRNLPRIRELRSLIGQAGGGGIGTVALAKGAEWGLDLGDKADAGAAANALISQLVPQQRPPGSGVMSDADLALYRNSLPELQRSAGGNELILDTMEAISEYDIAMGDLADRMVTGELTYPQGRAEMKKLRNPIDDFKKKKALMGKSGPSSAYGAQQKPAKTYVWGSGSGR